MARASVSGGSLTSWPSTGSVHGQRLRAGIGTQSRYCGCDPRFQFRSLLPRRSLCPATTGSAKTRNGKSSLGPSPTSNSPITVRPLGWQSRYSPSENTRALLVEHGGFLSIPTVMQMTTACSVKVDDQPHLVVPHSFTNNDNGLATAKLGTAEDFYHHLASALRVLYAEGARHPRMMTVSLHSRISGRPRPVRGDHAVSRFCRPALRDFGLPAVRKSRVIGSRRTLRG